MNAPATSDRPDSTRYLQVWAELLGQVLSEISASTWSCTVLAEASAESAPADASDLWIVVGCTGVLRGEMSLRVPAAAGSRLAQIFMSEPASEQAQLSAEHQEAVVELLRQVGGLVTTSIKATWGEVQLLVEPSAAAPSWAAATKAWLRVGAEASALVPIEIQLSAALDAGLRVEASSAPQAEPSSAPTAQRSSPGISPSQATGDLSLLMDVELSVTLRFGGRRLQLREVLDLSPGSVVELDRQVEEPIEMLLDGKILARGEIVVIDGNYGLRVTEVAAAKL